MKTEQKQSNHDIRNWFLGTLAVGGMLLGFPKILNHREPLQKPSLEQKIEKVEDVNDVRNVSDVNYVVEKNEIDYNDLYDSLIKHEGKRDTAYLDSKGIMTVGVGFNLEKKGAKERIEKLGLDYEKVLNKEQKVPQEIIYTLMKEDTETAISDAKQYVGNSWNSLDSDAKEIITNMAFNLGYSRLSGFKKLKQSLINQDYQTASQEMRDSKWYHQVGDRSKELVGKMNEVK